MDVITVVVVELSHTARRGKHIKARRISSGTEGGGGGGQWCNRRTTIALISVGADETPGPEDKSAHHLKIGKQIETLSTQSQLQTVTENRWHWQGTTTTQTQHFSLFLPVRHRLRNTNYNHIYLIHVKLS